MRSPIYPWLLSAYPVCHLYAENIQEVRDSEVLWTLLACLLFTSVVYFAIQIGARNRHKSAIITTSVLILFFFGLKLPLFVLLPSVLALLLFAWKCSAQQTLEQSTLILTVSILALLAIPSVTISQHLLRVLSLDVDEVLSVGQRPSQVDMLRNSPERPDIYYIIPDGYSANAHLSREWDYDNSSFTDALEDLGFFVAYDSKSNYGSTLNSLSSSLNLRYVEENATGGDLADRDYLRMLIADNLVARFLMERGYTYLYMNSGTLFPSTTAKINFDVTGNGLVEQRLSDLDPRLSATQREEIRNDWYNNHFRRFSMRSFCFYFFEKTLLRVAKHALMSACTSEDLPLSWDETSRFFTTLDKAKTIPEMPEATFTLVHLLKQ
ncbi:MAG: hypothetical protein GY906_34355, partial [bacterium]|nr:hypothetical protein [bacterium]